ncbi:BRAMP protein [Bacillus sp. HMSC76G11]|uniref:flavodoxin family protein n=1 Tax=Metabacillus idriensis TaxID=324768 RepID=UPI0008A9E51B|nr:NAD(P)H-dependent oxidoreductase [Metabacillus idriensis]OHR71633.1 BRAMP protein [Bacillus sp. HMSC76G11]
MLKALYLNCSLKKGNEPSNTESLMRQSQKHMVNEHVQTEELRISDYNIAFGMAEDMGRGDEWPLIMKKIADADIVVIGTPLWLGEKSSIASLVMERLYASSSETNAKGQSIYYNKVGGVAVTGNEDGAKEAARSILYGMQHIGFLIPPNADVYWVGEAGPGPSYMEAGKENPFTIKNTRTMSLNLVHLARLLAEHPIPAAGNTL